MNEEDVKSKTKSEVNSLLASLPIEIRGIIGVLLIYFLFLGGMQFIGNKENFSVNNCWTLEFKDNRTFKFNTCNGEIIEIDSKTLKEK